MVPSGASTGRFEAVELRDRSDSRLDGLGVRQAVRNVCTEIASAIIGLDADDQAEIDRRLIELDGTPQKSRLGANAILGTSLAVAYASAEARGVSPVIRFREIWDAIVGHVEIVLDKLGMRMLLPLPMVNMISGGLAEC